MVSALNMELDIVRTVFRNNASEAGVYADIKRDAGSYYTMVSIFSKQVAKEIAGRIAIDGLFGTNGDFVGSFTHKDALRLVFLYHPESRLANKEAIYAKSFRERKELAFGLLAALAETDAQGDIGRLLITDRNINITPEGKVYLNYFLDFERFSVSGTQDDFYSDAAEYAFGVLTRLYAAKYEQQVDMYPHELRLMHKKIQNRAFKSLSQIMAFVKALPDEPVEQRFGVMRLAAIAGDIKNFLLKKPANVFLAAVVIATLGYLGYQLAVRVMASKNMKENTVYVGMEQIGEVYLGEEDI